LVRWVFRIATDPRVGAGHFVRCRALALAMEQAPYVAVDPNGAGVDFSEWAHGVLVEPDAQAADLALGSLARNEAQAVLFDSYTIADQVREDAARRGFSAAFRDNPPYGPEALSIDLSPEARIGPNLISGPQFIPLDPAIVRNRVERSFRDPAQPFRVLIGFGARDSDNLTRLVLEQLKPIGEAIRATVLLTRDAPHWDTVKEMIDGLSWAGWAQDNTPVASVYGGHDLAIGAPGVSQYERAFCGLPTLLIGQNERHRPLLDAWSRTGATKAVPAEAGALLDILRNVMGAPDVLQEMSRRAQAIVDGNGARRLAAALQGRRT
jgi:spore coat polysaccharide biosynthesis predicted glycosyltransferase SpsG